MKTTLCLASRSPRRREILEWAGFEVLTRPADIDESWDQHTAPISHARRLAENKAITITSDHLILAADTLVHIDNDLFEKPKDELEARQHLTALSGRWHHVTTGVCLRYNSKSVLFSTTTRVRFRTLSLREIKQYVDTGEPMDKAGAYGIQGIGGNLVAEVQGSWTNVKGLPLEDCIHHIEQLLTDAP